MPVYVSRAHVTIGNVTKKEKKRKIVPKHVFHVSDIGRTPYCFRTFLVTIIGFVIVLAGSVMTLLGYKPSIILPWFISVNETSDGNQTEPEMVANSLGEPGDLRVLVYIGPVVMGIGVFSMMVAIVLFCEIKDRYFNNILPKIVPHHLKKDKMYDKVIEEFRKNYFRGIEVPLRPPRKRSKCRFSFSLSPSGSLASFGRRLSHDFHKKLRRNSHVSKTEKITTKPNRPSLKKYMKDDSWMKTSSLPNINPKGNLKFPNKTEQSLENIPVTRFQRPIPGLDTIPILHAQGPVDNSAYHESPTELLVRRQKLTKHSSLDSSTNKYVTTVIVHQLPNNEPSSNTIVPNTRVADLSNSKDMRKFESSCDSSDSDLDIRDIILSPLYNERQESSSGFIPIEPNYTSPTPETHLTPPTCTCGADNLCTEHTNLGMESGDSSLSLSWDNVPTDWNDSRRNTEPVVIYKRSFNNTSSEYFGHEDLKNTLSCNLDLKTETTSFVNGWCNKSDDNLIDTQSRDVKCVEENRKMNAGNFKTCTTVFNSDSNLLNVGTYSFISNGQYDALSLDSLYLTEDMLKNFDVSDSAYI